MAGEVLVPERCVDHLVLQRCEMQAMGPQDARTLLVELPKGDFAKTIARQFFFSSYALAQSDALRQSSNAELSGIAVKMHKESRYHVRHSGDWMLRLGLGTDESHARLQAAVDELWHFTGELFDVDDVERDLVADGIAVDRATLKAPWRTEVARVLQAATLSMPDDGFMQRGGREGRHTEHLGHLLAEMQIVARSYPGTEW